ncbi:glycosyltransferase [Chryseobacterium sp. JAH]|uniref:glycosyltransferase n=1 Tax=Chryseobacterium sp. JAH TaxID=1742858 RepID=UPI00074122C6|nr:glycosyltransferase family 2 protein [Chryseobacterium sp. JAH]KUJ50604.1 glycosyl transferase family 2 [Chryseobacterium sp. JAH]
MEKYINKVTASIVLYNTDKKELERIVKNLFDNYKSLILYLIDNSPTDVLKMQFERENIIYIFNPSNPGFGAAHNIALKEALLIGSEYHLVVNPDTYFNEDIISPMIEYMQQNPDVGMMMPRILNEDGTIQNLPKLLPSPYSVLMRKLKKPTTIYKRFINNYELRFIDENLIYNAPILSGCFTIIKMRVLQELGCYDDKFFMYFEDWDLSRRIHRHYKTIYFPKVSVYHGYHSGANKSRKLFKIFINSAITYFNKWGWFSDRERALINKETLKQFL